MNHKHISDLWDILVCPYCGEPLKIAKQGAICNCCNTFYEYTKSGSLDLRLKKPKKCQYKFKIGSPLLPKTGFVFEKLPEKRSEVNYNGINIPHNIKKELLSYFPKPGKKGSLMLDLGCGRAIHREICEHAGFKYVGLDYNSMEATILGDAHSLPFTDECFDFILSIAVLEHIRFPFLLVSEAYRVLKSNSKFIGTVAFLEPFHEQSYYHHTHLGIYNLLNEAGFEINHISPSVKWAVLKAQARMGLFPGMPSIISNAIILPLNLAHRAWWKIARVLKKRATEINRINYTTGSFTFIVTKKAT